MKRFILTLVGCIWQLTILLAQEVDTTRHVNFALEYTTELQTDFSKGANWVNLLRADANITFYDSENHSSRKFGKSAPAKNIIFGAQVATISVAKTRGESLLDDYQGFSNIEEENLPLAIALLGLDLQIGNSELFVGVRNVNEDHFTSTHTSIFTGSSYGIHPTLSAGLPLPNYPLSALCIDFKQVWGDLTWKSSLYGGSAYNGFKAKDNPFIIAPKKDGVLAITAFEYDHKNSHYCIGGLFHHGKLAEIETPGLVSTGVVWANIEQQLGYGGGIAERLHLMLQGSVNFPGVLPSGSFREGMCRHYEALALTANFNKFDAAIGVNHASFVGGREIAAELTVQVPVFRSLAVLQPTLHLVHTDGATRCLGLLRIVISI